MLKLVWLILLLINACGKNSPFDEDYWDEPGREEENRSDEVRVYTAELAALTPNVGNLNGEVSVTVDENSYQTNIQLSDVPHSIIQAQRTFTTATCDTFRTLNFPDFPNGTGEVKSINQIETGTVEGLLSELNQGSSTNLDGRRVVVSVFLSNNSPDTQSPFVIPVACGALTVSTSQEDDAPDDGGGTTTGGTNTGGMTTGGAATGGTIGGTIGGTTMGGTTGDF